MILGVFCCCRRLIDTIWVVVVVVLFVLFCFVFVLFCLVFVVFFTLEGGDSIK